MIWTTYLTTSSSKAYNAVAIAMGYLMQALLGSQYLSLVTAMELFGHLGVIHFLVVTH